MKNIMTVKEVAKLLDISEMTVHRMIEDGRLTPINKPNPVLKRQRWEFDRAYVESLISDPNSEARPLAIAS